MKSGEINSLFKNLSKVIKNPRSDLKYKNKFTLLLSVVLSAQCTDVNVNNVTKNIYPKYNNPWHFAKLGRKKICTREKISVWFTFFSEIKYKPAYHQICKERDLYYQSITEDIFAELIKKENIKLSKKNIKN